EAGVMKQAPPVPGASLLSREALTTTIVDATVMAASSLGAFVLAQRRSGNALHASTMAFTTLSAGQLLYALACRSTAHSGVRGLRDNPALIAGVGGMLALQAATLVVPPLRALLRTTPLGVGDLAIVGAGALAPWLLRESFKTISSEDAKHGGSRG